MTESEYNLLPGIRASAIKAGAVSMKHMRAAMMGQLVKESPALAWGATVHAAILEPERFWQGVAIWQGEAKRGKEWTAFKEAAGDRTILTDTERLNLERLIDAVYSNSAAAGLIEGAEHEVTQTWKDPAYGFGKCRFDGLAAGYWLEVKTTRAIDRRRFASQFYSLGYDLQCGWYSQAAVPPRPCYMIVAESSPPFDCIVYQIPSDVIAKGLEAAAEIARRYRACEVASLFDGVDLGSGIVEFVPPAWTGGGEKWTVGETTEGSAEL